MKKQSLTFLIIVFLAPACGNNGNAGAGNTEPPATTDTSAATTTPAPTTATVTEPPKDKNVDLAILGVNMQKVTEGGTSTYRFTADLINTGSDPATFDCHCNWSCPGGQILTNGVEVIQAGYLAPGKRLPYYGQSTRPCDPVPAFLTVKCEIKARSGHIDGNLSNNKWVGNINMY